MAKTGTRFQAGIEYDRRNVKTKTTPRKENGERGERTPSVQLWCRKEISDPDRQDSAIGSYRLIDRDRHSLVIR